MGNALIVYGGWEGHEPRQVVETLAAPLRDNGFGVEMCNALDVFSDAEKMAATDLIVIQMSGVPITDEQLAGLLSAVRAGTGLAGVHGGMCDTFRTRPAYQFMCGGQFVSHPGGMIRYTVNVADSEDPVMADLNDFEVESEQYYMHVDPSNHVLATTTFSGGHGHDWIAGCVMPVVWKRRYGRGRVFYSGLGHVAKDFVEVPEMLTIATRGMLWAARQDGAT
jgi:uncharacterized protein